MEAGERCGYGAGQTVEGRERPALVGTDGRALVLDTQPASVQDRDGAVPILRQSRRSFPFVTKTCADAGLAGERPRTARSIDVEIVRKPPDQVGFVAHPRRWVPGAGSGKRFFAWIRPDRCLWQDAGAALASTAAFSYAASVTIHIRRLARPS